MIAKLTLIVDALSDPKRKKKNDALYKLIFKIILLTLHTGLSLLYTIMKKKKDPNIHNKIFKMILDMDGRVSGQSLKYLTCQSLSAFKGVYAGLY